MKKTMLPILMLLVFNFRSFSQDAASAKAIVQEGIVLHDAGKYPEAIEKYKAALEADKYNIDALYELALTYSYNGDSQDCIDVCKRAMKLKMGDFSLKNFYVTLGSAYDNLKDPDKAIKTYNEGLRKFPDFYLLHFNKGITLTNMQEYDDALSAFENAVSLNPLHSSSHYYIMLLNEKSNRIPTIMSAGMVIILENGSKRAGMAYTIFSDAMQAGVSRNGNNVTINISADVLDKKNKKKESNFSMAEMMMSLMAASKDDKAIDSIAKTPADKLSFQLQMLANSLCTGRKDGKGIYWKMYAPFYADMKEKDYMTIFSHIILLQMKDADNQQWIEGHKSDVDTFMDWVKNYKWNSR